ncbi:hypothetical protein RhiirA5_364609 [Rhizophagus irregularis]|uniref:Uncharacterized protein n=1 Tax=Rhizophagus irregularis TaxID=588596 RepID=A0A2N0P553_9GLOM|nr:hypothetical protein RhiirA5_364609 [Rhizophagus irregularis]
MYIYFWKNYFCFLRPPRLEGPVDVGIASDVFLALPRFAGAGVLTVSEASDFLAFLVLLLFFVSTYCQKE